ncbi:MAG: DUF4157 domain-containing protein [Anaerolineae bacterium]|nr:DUF4157 domain-containing protein [Anaerolineae bacterium]
MQHTVVGNSKATQPAPSPKASVQTLPHVGHSHEEDSILQLQHTVGNQAVQKLLRSKAEERNAVLSGTNSPHFGHDFSRIPVNPPTVGGHQMKLAINKAGGEYVQDSNTEQVATPPIVHEVLQSPGQPLQPATRAFMEARFGHNFSMVRMHTNRQAAQSAADVGARAYTVGQHIVFGQGEYIPASIVGQRLIAHELAHVIQQRSGGNYGDAPDSSAMEYGAEQAAGAIRLGGGRVTVAGMAQIGMALLPRSYRSSEDISNWSQSEIETEIREIRQWLESHPEESEDRQRLLGVLRTLEHLVPGVVSGLSIADDEFATRFNDEFRHILPSLEPDTRSGTLSADRLAGLFTPEQREKLADFIVTRRIPERLFNGADDIGGANAQQRILIAAHILTYGTYRPGSVEQRVHARYCGHWVQIVHQYAGTLPASGGWPEHLPIAVRSTTPRGSRRARGAIMGGFDPMGVPVFGAGQAEYAFRSTRFTPEQFPIPEGTDHAATAAKEEERVAADPNTRRRVHRRSEMAMSDFDGLQSGDWLYLYNANRSASGQHSVIFSHFVDAVAQYQEGVPYRRAVVFNQPHPDSAGVERTIYLGEQFITSRKADREQGIPYRHKIDTITLVVRVAASAQPASSVAELLPSPGRPERIVQQNNGYIQRIGRQRNITVDRNRLIQWLQDENASSITSLGDLVTDRERGLFIEANRNTDLELLVRLCQRLRALSTNAALLEQTRRESEQRLTTQHEAAQTQLDTRRQQLAPDLAALETQLKTAQERSDELNSRPTASEIGDQQSELRALERRIGRLARGEERTRLRAERTGQRSRINELKAQRRAELREQGSLRRQIARLQRQQSRIQEQLSAAAAKLPHSLLPGKVSGEDPGFITGRLQDLTPPPPWSDLIDQTTSTTRQEE